jgi:hypothetical protein
LSRSCEEELANLVVCHLPLPVAVPEGESRPMTVAGHMWFVYAMWYSCNNDPLGICDLYGSDFELRHSGLDVSDSKIPKLIYQPLRLIAGDGFQTGSAFLFRFHADQNVPSLCVGKRHNVRSPLTFVKFLPVLGLSRVEYFGLELEEGVFSRLLSNEVEDVGR